MKGFSQVIKQLRNEKELTQQELADYLNVAKSTISMYENGKREPDFEKLEEIADFFNVNVDFLLGKSIFMNEVEESHTIRIACMEYIIKHPEVIPYGFDTGGESLFYKELSKEVETYCDTLLNKFNNNNKLSLLELFELSNIIFSEIKWSHDGDGVIYLEDFFSNSMIIQLDYKILTKHNLNLSQSILFKYMSTTNISYKHSYSLFTTNTDTNSRNTTNNTELNIESHIDGEPLSEEEQQDVIDYIKFVVSKRKK